MLVTLLYALPDIGEYIWHSDLNIYKDNVLWLLRTKFEAYGA